MNEMRGSSQATSLAQLLDALPLAVYMTNAEGVLTCQVKEGRAKARFTRDAQFALGEHLVEDDGGFAFQQGSKRWRIEQIG